MATYNQINPPTLANLAAAYNDPTTNEDANKLWQVDVQTRKFIYDYLATKFSPTTGFLLAAAVESGSTLTGKVRGTTANVGGTAQEISQGTVSTPDLRDSAVTSVKIAADAVVESKIADLQVSTNKLAALAVTAAKIADTTITAGKLATDAVETAKIKNDAVTTAKILDDNVTAAKIADGAVGSDQLLVGTAEGNLLLAGVNPYKFATKAMSGDATINKDGVLTLTTRNECEIHERANNATNAGASFAGTWSVRGISPAWVEVWRIPTAQFLTLGANGKFSLPVGTYIISGGAPVYNSGKHITRVVRYNNSDVVQETVYGSSAKGGTGDQHSSFFSAKITIGATNDYVKIEHWTEGADAQGLGIASASGGTYEIYARVNVRQIA